jgi:predicted acyltransferase
MSEITEQKRLVSLDVFRGMTIAGMVLVNNPGTWSAIYSPLEHAKWHGWTPTDMIFPFFVFIMGVAIPIALGKRLEQGVTPDVYWKIIKRSLIIFGLGLFLATFPFYNFTKETWVDPFNVRIMGVLQRLALCYLFSSFIFLWFNWKNQLYIAVGLLLFYWILMIYGGNGDLTPEGNFSGYVDRLILTEAHIWKSSKVFDPEGLLSTLPAISSCLAGVLCGTFLKTKRDDYEKVSAFFFFGVVLVAIGWAWDFFFPINKSLWTSSYVVFMAGQALCFLGFCYWLIDIKGYKKWTKPFVIFGVNALALFVGSGVMARLLGIIKVGEVNGEGNRLSLQQWIFNNLFLSWASPINASLAYAICFILVWLGLMWLLYRKNIYIKV